MADHAVKNTDTSLMVERVKSIAGIIAALYFVVNTVLSSFGINPLPFTNDEVSAAVSSVGAVVMTVFVWWRQNVITKAANDGHKLTAAIKNGSVFVTQGTDTAPEVAAVSDTTTGNDVVLDTVTGTPVIEVG